MKKTLILVRHATAEEAHFRMKDFERQLVSKGFTEAAIMGKWMVEKGIKPDRFLSSPAARAYKTAEIVADQLRINIDEIVLDRDLYDGGPRAYLSAVTTTPPETEMLVLFGHNPDITYFGEYLSGSDIGSMKKGGVAIIDFENFNWDEVSSKTGSLVSYTSPQDVIKSHE